MLPVEKRSAASKSSLDLLAVELMGVPVVSWQAKPLPIVRRQARAILYRLACAGTPLSRETLADLLWPEREPASARRHLVKLLSALRAELPERDLLQADRTAVWLRSDRLICDVQRFHQLAISLAVSDWETAVALYRGPFLSGFLLPDTAVFDHWQQAFGYELERQYLQLLGKLVDHLQHNGDNAKAIYYAKRYLAVDELAEAIHRSLITLYASSGRRVDALQQYSRCVQVLHQELGVDPLPETRAAFEAARDGVSVADPQRRVAPSWSTLPGLELPLTGRDESWRVLEAAFQKRQSGGVLLISGAPGIGKSRLMQEFATRRTGIVLVGNCHTGSQAAAFEPLVQALRQALEMGHLQARVRLVWLAELVVLLPELREQVTDLPPPLPLTPDQSQARLLEALWQAFRSLASESTLLLCLDDLHAADEGTLSWLNYSVGKLANSQICLLVTYRSQEERRLVEWRRALSRSGLSSDIRLEALNLHSVELLLQQSGARLELAPGIHRATGGNAFFLLETIRELLERPVRLPETRAVPLARSVRETILRRADRLDPLARQVLDMAAVLSPILTVSLLAQSTARDELEVAEVLDELVRRQFLLPEEESFRFQHDLTREAIGSAVSPWRLRLLHRRAARALQRERLVDGDLSASIAAHYELAGDLAEAVDNYETAAIKAQQINAFQIAVAYLQKALQLLPEGDEWAIRKGALQEQLGDCLRLTGRFKQAVQRYRNAVEITSMSETTTRARIQWKMMESLWPTNEAKAAFRVARKALAELAPAIESDLPSAWHVWLEIQLSLAWARYWTLDLSGLSSTLRAIASRIEDVGSPEQVGRWHSYLALHALLDRRYRLGRETVEQAQALFERSRLGRDRLAIANAGFRLGFALLWAGELAAAEVRLHESEQIARDLELRLLQVQCLTYIHLAQRLQGKVAEARALWPQVWQMALEVGSLAYISMCRAMRSWLAYRDNELDTAQAEAEAAVASWEILPIPFQWSARWILLAIALRNGRSADAIAEASAMVAPPQHLQEEPIFTALETAVKLWNEGQPSLTQDKLREALLLAEKYHYL